MMFVEIFIQSGIFSIILFLFSHFYSFKCINNTLDNTLVLFKFSAKS